MFDKLSFTRAQKITRRCLSIALAGVVFFSYNGVFGLSEDEQAAKLKQLRETMEQLQKELEKTKDSRESLLKDLEKSEKSAGELNEKAKELEDTLEQRQENLNNLDEERSQLNLKKKTNSNKLANT